MSDSIKWKLYLLGDAQNNLPLKPMKVTGNFASLIHLDREDFLILASPDVEFHTGWESQLKKTSYYCARPDHMLGKYMTLHKQYYVTGSMVLILTKYDVELFNKIDLNYPINAISQQMSISLQTGDWAPTYCIIDLVRAMIKADAVPKRVMIRFNLFNIWNKVELNLDRTKLSSVSLALVDWLNQDLNRLFQFNFTYHHLIDLMISRNIDLYQHIDYGPTYNYPNRIYVVSFSVHQNKEPGKEELNRKMARYNYWRCMERLKANQPRAFVITVFEASEYFSDIGQYGQQVNVPAWIGQLPRLIKAAFRNVDYDYLIRIDSGWEIELDQDIDCDSGPHHQLLSKQYLSDHAEWSTNSTHQLRASKQNHGPPINWPEYFQPQDYTVFLGSNRFNLVQKLRKTLPYLVHYDGRHVPSFSYLVNQCIRNCPTEIFIFISDKVRPSQNDIDKLVNLIKSGYAFVATYSFACFGFKKDLVRSIGYLDESIIGGGYEDLDYLNRIIEHKLPFYHTNEVTYIESPSIWRHDLTHRIYNDKWWTDGPRLNRKKPDRRYDGSMGPIQDPNWFNTNLQLVCADNSNRKFPKRIIVSQKYQECPYIVTKHFPLTNCSDQQYQSVINTWLCSFETKLEISAQEKGLKDLLNHDIKLITLNRVVNNIDNTDKQEDKQQLVVVNSYATQDQCKKMLVWAATQLIKNGHILFYERKHSTEYDGYLYHGQIHWIWREIKFVHNQLLSVITMSYYPGLLLAQLR